MAGINLEAQFYTQNEMKNRKRDPVFRGIKRQKTHGEKRCKMTLLRAISVLRIPFEYNVPQTNESGGNGGCANE